MFSLFRFRNTCRSCSSFSFFCYFQFEIVAILEVFSMCMLYIISSLLLISFMCFSAFAFSFLNFIILALSWICSCSTYFLSATACIIFVYAFVPSILKPDWRSLSLTLVWYSPPKELPKTVFEPYMLDWTLDLIWFKVLGDTCGDGDLSTFYGTKGVLDYSATGGFWSSSYCAGWSFCIVSGSSIYIVF